MKTILLMSIIFLGLNGCGDSKKTEKKEKTFKTVEYYIQNKEAREARKKECMAMIETTQTISQECKNVEIAIRKTRPIGKLQDKSHLFD